MAAVEANSAGAEEEEARAGSSGFNPQIDLGKCLLVARGAPCRGLGRPEITGVAGGLGGGVAGRKWHSGLELGASV